MNYEDLRNTIRSWPKHVGCKVIDRSSLVNKGFPGTFNISFGEDPVLREYGRYQHFDHDYVFSAIQSVVRAKDLFNGVINNPERYLGVFEMSDVYGMICLKHLADMKDICMEQTKSVVELLTSLGIKRKNIRPKYCGGGLVSELTAGKYSFDKKIPEDRFTLEAFLEAGIPRSNIIADHTRDTFLALRLCSGEIAWGYRSEIEVERQNSPLPLDVATTESFMWDPISNENGQIIGLRDIDYTVALTVTGIERLYMVHKDLADIREIDHLKEIHNLVPNSTEAEYIRTLHAIFADKIKFGFEFGKHRANYLNKMVRSLSLEREKINELLQVNAESQPWHAELQSKDGTDQMLQYIDRIKGTK